MVLKGVTKRGVYYDSVTLMIVSKRINEMEGVTDSSVVMGTRENKAILKAAGLLVPEFSPATDTDLLISIKAGSEDVAARAVEEAETLLGEVTKKQGRQSASAPRSWTQAMEQLEGANLALVSIAGRYAAAEARKALEQGLHVMLFSDNVSIEEEVVLKSYAKSKGLLMMGPDCGTAIINGVPLAFGNVAGRGHIGIVAASGTGLQETSSIISNHGAGISQAIGTGGRDVKKEVGGMMFIEALKALNNDEDTHCILLISKPPDNEVLEKIAVEIRRVKKPVVAIFIGGNLEQVRRSGAIPVADLEEAALVATNISRGEDVQIVKEKLTERENEISVLAEKLSTGRKGRFVRGLFSGGTLCDEAQLLLKGAAGYVWSNTPLHDDYRLKNPWKSKGHTVIDMGEDAFTTGRPHPMIDFSLRNKRIGEEAADKEVAVILFDVVLGHGAHLSPADELVPAIREATAAAPGLLFVCSVTGTDGDPQNRRNVIQQLENAGVVVMRSNSAAAMLTGKIIQNIAR